MKTQLRPGLSSRSVGKRRSSCHTAADRSVAMCGEVIFEVEFGHPIPSCTRTGHVCRSMQHWLPTSCRTPNENAIGPGRCNPRKAQRSVGHSTLPRSKSLDTGQSSLPACKGSLKLDDSCFNPCMVAAEPRGTTRDWTLNCSSQMNLTSCTPGVTGESPHSRRIMQRSCWVPGRPGLAVDGLASTSDPRRSGVVTSLSPRLDSDQLSSSGNDVILVCSQTPFRGRSLLRLDSTLLFSAATYRSLVGSAWHCHGAALLGARLWVRGIEYDRMWTMHRPSNRFDGV